MLTRIEADKQKREIFDKFERMKAKGKINLEMLKEMGIDVDSMNKGKGNSMTGSRFGGSTKHSAFGGSGDKQPGMLTSRSQMNIKSPGKNQGLGSTLSPEHGGGKQQQTGAVNGSRNNGNKSTTTLPSIHKPKPAHIDSKTSKPKEAYASGSQTARNNNMNTTKSNLSRSGIYSGRTKKPEEKKDFPKLDRDQAIAYIDQMKHK